MALCPFRTEWKTTFKNGKFTERSEVFAECFEDNCPCFRKTIFNYPPMVVKECMHNNDPLTLEVIHQVERLTKEDIAQLRSAVKKAFDTQETHKS